MHKKMMKMGEEDEEDKLVVQARINLEIIDIENTKFIRVIGFINGEETKQDIPISSIDKSKNSLNVELKVDKENDIVEASTPDEFFVCAYQVEHDNGIVVEKIISYQNLIVMKVTCSILIHLYKLACLVLDRRYILKAKHSMKQLDI